MALDIVFTRDIECQIVSLGTSMLCAAAAQGADNVEYCKAVLDTCRGFALAYGRSWRTIEGNIHSALISAGHKDFAEWLLSGIALVSEEKEDKFLYPQKYTP